MPTVNIPATCALCMSAFKTRERVIFISEAIVYRDYSPVRNEMGIRRLGGRTKRIAIHPACWEVAQTNFRSNNENPRENW
jgi:hypothetical protein